MKRLLFVFVSLSLLGAGCFNLAQRAPSQTTQVQVQKSEVIEDGSETSTTWLNVDWTEPKQVLFTDVFKDALPNVLPNGKTRDQVTESLAQQGHVFERGTVKDGPLQGAKVYYTDFDSADDRFQYHFTFVVPVDGKTIYLLSDTNQETVSFNLPNIKDFVVLRRYIALKSTFLPPQEIVRTDYQHGTSSTILSLSFPYNYSCGGKGRCQSLEDTNQKWLRGIRPTLNSVSITISPNCSYSACVSAKPAMVYVPENSDPKFQFDENRIFMDEEPIEVDDPDVTTSVVRTFSLVTNDGRQWTYDETLPEDYDVSSSILSLDINWDDGQPFKGYDYSLDTCTGNGPVYVQIDQAKLQKAGTTGDGRVIYVDKTGQKNTALFSEGGSGPDEYRSQYVPDVVNAAIYNAFIKKTGHYPPLVLYVQSRVDRKSYLRYAMDAGNGEECGGY